MIESFKFKVFFALYRKEVSRFMKVFNQTIVAPAVTSLLFLAVFILSIGQFKQTVGGMSFLLFMGVGLIIMSVVQNSFSNSASSLTQSRVIGSIVDYLIPPFSPAELILGLMLSSMTRGVMVGLVVALVLSIFVEIEIFNVFYMVFFLISSSMFLSLLGILTGIFSDNYDKMSAISSYIITPFSFLSGTFYSIKNLPNVLYELSHFNPFFYMIDGFRYGMTGYSDAPIMNAVSVMVCVNLCAFSYAYFLIKVGHKIKD